MRILVIEDNPDIAANLGDYLEDRGHTVDFAADGVTGLHLAVVHDFDAIVLDLNLPGMDGLEVCRKLRNEARKQNPGADADRARFAGEQAGQLRFRRRRLPDQAVRAAGSGCAPERARPPLAAVRRRACSMSARLEFNLDTLEVRREGKLLQLNPTALKILQALMEATPAVVTRRTRKPGSGARNCRIRIRCGCISTACARWWTNRSPCR